MLIRPAERPDAQALSLLLAQVWRVAYRGIFPDTFLDHIQEDGWTAGFTTTLSDPQITTLVAEIEGNIVGMIAFGKGRDHDLPQGNEIYALNVLPQYQQQQIGSALMAECLTHLQPSNRPIYLKVATENQIAQAFYLKHGFYNSQRSQQRQIADFTFQEWVFIR